MQAIDCNWDVLIILVDGALTFACHKECMRSIFLAHAEEVALVSAGQLAPRGYEIFVFQVLIVIIFPKTETAFIDDPLVLSLSFIICETA